MGQMKLCDFGSATTKAMHPDSSWTHQDRSLAEEQVREKETLFLVKRERTYVFFSSDATIHNSHVSSSGNAGFLFGISSQREIRYMGK